MKIKEDIVDRFWSKVLKTDKCWKWLAGTFNSGYGVFTISSKSPIRAHRFSYFLLKGDIPKDKVVCHKCDNKLCVNPDHLFLGTPLDNAKDREAKGRTARGLRSGRLKHPESYKCFIGENNISSKLKEKDVLEIRELYATGNFSQSQLAKKYGVTKPLIRYIYKRKIWRHLP